MISTRWSWAFTCISGISLQTIKGGVQHKFKDLFFVVGTLKERPQVDLYVDETILVSNASRHFLSFISWKDLLTKKKITENLCIFIWSNYSLFDTEQFKGKPDKRAMTISQYVIIFGICRYWMFCIVWQFSVSKIKDRFKIIHNGTSPSIYCFIK